LIVGLPKDHIWHGGSVTSQNGIDFTPNLPTDEIFTLPDRDRVDGFVKITRPILIQGQIIEDCTFKFSKGRIIEANAKVGYEVIEKIINIDKGARGLGEIALVPHSSPISKTGLLFYNLLIDENASNHIALGQAYRNSLKNGITLSDEEFTAAGGNNSSIHIDLMVGSGEMDVDGVLEDETTESIMRNGEWVFEV
ncbi:MAG: aminopeptidase, partial [Promethearchaeota archaeon]